MLLSVMCMKICSGLLQFLKEGSMNWKKIQKNNVRMEMGIIKSNCKGIKRNFTRGEIISLKSRSPGIAGKSCL